MTHRTVLLCALLALVSLLPVQARELLRFRVVNDADGAISVSRDCGAQWTQVGKVVRFTTQVSRQGYTASKWVPYGHVAATAVNALHISAGYNAADDRGVVFSLLPKEFMTAPKGYGSFLSPDSSIYTDLPAGRSIFGGGEAPLVGNPVFLEKAGELTPMPDGYVPAQGDVLVVEVLAPEHEPSEVVFENHAGGRVTLVYRDGSSRQLGWVVKPVQGVGRFLGGLYTERGRIRANHAGVIDVSTSRVGFLGGFQILPFGHSLSPEMATAWNLTQWLVVGPLNDSPGIWQDATPLFWGHLRPDYLTDDLYAADWETRLLSRYLVDVDMGKGWQPMPPVALPADPNVPLPAWAGHALDKVERIRILFPLAERAGVDAGAVQ